MPTLCVALTSGSLLTCENGMHGGVSEENDNIWRESEESSVALCLSAFVSLA